MEKGISILLAFSSSNRLALWAGQMASILVLPVYHRPLTVPELKRVFGRMQQVVHLRKWTCSFTCQSINILSSLELIIILNSRWCVKELCLWQIHLLKPGGSYRPYELYILEYRLSGLVSFFLFLCSVQQKTYQKTKQKIKDGESLL